MRINVAIPEAHVSEGVLNAALESVTRLNESMLKQDTIPSFERGLKQGVKWQPEPPGDEHFDHAGLIYKRRWGDCDDLAPWHAASLRHSGEDSGAKAVVKRTGPKMWHAVVQRSNGDIDDPSKRAGMGQPHEYAGAFLPKMNQAPRNAGVNGAYIVRPQLALRPVRDGYQARTDIPWHYRQDLDKKPSASDYAMVSLHASPVASTALTGAIDGAIELAEAAGFADPEHLERLRCLGDACDGASYNELARNYGPEAARAASAVVGSFFGHIKSLASKGLHAGLSLAKMAAPMAASFVPGGSAALSLASQASHLMPHISMPHMPHIDLGNLPAYGLNFGDPVAHAFPGMPGAAAAAPAAPGTTGEHTGTFNAGDQSGTFSVRFS